MDMQTRNAKDLSPAQPILKRIASLDSKGTLPRSLAYLERAGVSGMWGTMIDQDSKQSSSYMLYIAQSGLGMPDRDYYLKDDAESVRVRSAYRIHAQKVFALMGYAPKKAAGAMETLLRIETELAKAHMPKEDLRDPEKTYHKMSVAAVAKRFPRIDWRAFLKAIGAGDLAVMNVMQPGFLERVNELVEEVPLDEWKEYLSWHAVNDLAGALSDRFVRQNFSFYGRSFPARRRCARAGGACFLR